MTKILMTADTVGGVWTYALHLIEALAEHDVQFVMCSCGRLPDIAQRAAVARLPNVTLLESDFRLEWMQQPWEDVARTRRWLQQTAQIHQPDILHLNDYSHAAADWPVPVLVVGHSCVLSWHEAVRRCGADQSWDRYRQAVTAGIRSADFVVAPSQAMLQALERHYGPTSQSRVIHNGRDCPAASAAVEKQRQVLTAGRLWDEAKNVATVVRAAERIQCPVYIAGEVADPDGRSTDVRSVQWLGKLTPEQLAKQYASTAIYALPARYEPFGYTPLEAALHGCALVLGDIASLREIWEDAAIYVSPDDDHELAAAVNRLLNNPSLLRRQAAAAHQRAARYSGAAMAEGYLDLYRQLLTNRRQPFNPGRSQACVS